MTSGSAWPPTVQRARALVLAHGWNATAYQLVNPGICHWFAASGDGVVGYVRSNGVRVVAGAPVCPPDRLADVAAEFEHDTTVGGEGICYFGAERRLEALYRDSPGHSRVLLGAQPIWTPAGWPSAIRRRASVRGQLNRARNRGVYATEWLPARAAGSPSLARVLAEWLATRGLPPLHFLVEPDTLTRLDDRRVFVAECGDGDAAEAVGFVVASPVPARQGWLIEQFVRGRAAPNGTIELLLDTAITAMAASGARYVTLGLAPLSRHARADPDSPEPPWLRLLLAWTRAHASRFYNFGGLDAFKAKFNPDSWEPVYAIARGRRFSPRMMYAIAGAFGACSPAQFVGHALARAVRMEAARLVRR